MAYAQHAFNLPTCTNHGPRLSGEGGSCVTPRMTVPKLASGPELHAAYILLSTHPKCPLSQHQACSVPIGGYPGLHQECAPPVYPSAFRQYISRQNSIPRMSLSSYPTMRPPNVDPYASSRLRSTTSARYGAAHSSAASGYYSANNYVYEETFGGRDYNLWRCGSGCCLNQFGITGRAHDNLPSGF